ncbi:MAG: 3-deoxy-D-manno-octulosonic acid transferase, partial [Calditrichaeota bacterium]|nr:3-deoxy-D-manno-octulosonic acid transferase [Calditrichota bacterium]
LRQLHRSYGDLLTIICPHEPTPAHLAQLSDALLPLRGCRLSQLDHYRGEPVIVIDRIGILANLYALARAAYVGGSFKQNIHNVLEPAVYGIPVLFGPVNRNSHEAQLLKAAGGGLEVHSEAEIRTALEKIFSEEDYRRQTGEAARQLVEAHRGATARTVEEILKRLE